MKSPDSADLTLADFEAGRADPAAFSHREHVRMSFELLQRYTFPEALFRLAKGLRQLALSAGVPGKYHETITVAFLAVIAERRLGGGFVDWEDFVAGNRDLLRKEMLMEFYEPAVLESSAARETFILPRRAGGESS